MKPLTPSLLLRIGLAFAFIYPPISALFNPYAWIGYFPPLISSVPIDTLVLLHLFGIAEILLAVWIVSGKKIIISSSIAAGILTLIIIYNIHQIDVLFRDISILLMAITLTLLHKK